MTTLLVYQQYTQHALDCEYNNRAKVPDAEDHLNWYCSASETTRETVPCKLNISYCNSQHQTLDLFFQGDLTASLKPVHAFFHGGYWKALSKNEFSYIANVFENQDAICAVIDYGLIPTITMGELIVECQNALLWLYHNIANHGGNPNQISLSGHSAGGHLVAMMMATEWQTLDPTCQNNFIQSGVSLSGIFDLEPIKKCFLNDDLNLTNEDIKKHSPIHLPKQSKGKLTCYVGSLEGEEYLRQSQSLSGRWLNTETIIAPNHDHFSIAREAFNPNSELFGNLRRSISK